MPFAFLGAIFILVNEVLAQDELAMASSLSLKSTFNLSKRRPRSAC
jgi:hypothetical protein